MNRPVSIGLSPNLEFDDVQLAVKTLLSGSGKTSRQDVEKWFEEYFGGGYKAISFNSGRSAEWAIIKALGLLPDDEVLVQDFTCVAVPNSVHWAGVRTVDVKVEPGTYNMDPDDLIHKITKNSRAVIVQHTFGQAAPLTEIITICKKYHLVLIEDCAHALGASYGKKLLGTWGDVSFFSLGRDKVVSSVFGGVALTHDAKMAGKLKEIERGLPENSWGWVTQQLLHPILTWMFLPIYNFGLGKLGLWGAQKLHLLSKAVYPIEKRGGQPEYFPAKYPNSLAVLGMNQLKKLQRFNEHRRKIANIYFEQLKDIDLILPPKQGGDIYLRFTVSSPRARELYLLAKLERKWVLGDWYYISRQVLNLPTYPSFSEESARELCEQIKIWLKLKK